MTEIYLGNPPEHIKEWIKNHTEQEDPQLRTPLCFTANEPGATVSLIGWDENNYEQCDVFVHLQYSTDNMQTWSSGDWDGHEITLANTGDKVYIRASKDNVNGMAYYDEEQGYVTIYHKFYLTGSIGASGNIQYLLTLDGSRTDVPTYAYYYLFSSIETYNEETGEAEYSDTITTAPALPATTLADSCYYSMFNNCTSLTQAPALPATTLADSCYYRMFNSCTSLTQAPALPATTLATYCYSDMFNNCTSLTQAPALPATTLATYCYYSMFNNCTSLTQAPALPATTLANGCYYDMFYNCTSLTQAPALPATTLANLCYFRMFNNCTSLTQAPALPATTLADSCYFRMFNNCTSLTQAPALPATTLADSCYFRMFNSCTKLSSIDVSFTAWNPTNATSYWVSDAGTDATGTKTFTCPAALPQTRGSSNIPTGWTIVTK